MEKNDKDSEENMSSITRGQMRKNKRLILSFADIIMNGT
jgi:hypothetical protein